MFSFFSISVHLKHSRISEISLILCIPSTRFPSPKYFKTRICDNLLRRGTYFLLPGHKQISWHSYTYSLLVSEINSLLCYVYGIQDVIGVLFSYLFPVSFLSILICIWVFWNIQQFVKYFIFNMQMLQTRNMWSSPKCLTYSLLLP